MLVSLHQHRRREAASTDAVLPKRRPNTRHMAATTVIAEAIEELEAYDDTEHRAVLELVREILDLDDADAWDVY